MQAICTPFFFIPYPLFYNTQHPFVAWSSYATHPATEPKTPLKTPQKNHYKPRFSHTIRNTLIINNYALVFQNLLFCIPKA